MKKQNKIIVAVIAILAIATTALLVNQPESLTGRFGWGTPTVYYYNGNVVSGVASPVPSIVISEVVSEVPSEIVSPGGTSTIASHVPSSVPSVIVSPVASAVALQRNTAKKFNPKKLRKLTGKTLERIAKKDFKKNPKKFTLTNKEKAKIIKLYERNQKRSKK